MAGWQAGRQARQAGRQAGTQGYVELLAEGGGWVVRAAVVGCCFELSRARGGVVRSVVGEGRRGQGSTVDGWLAVGGQKGGHEEGG